MKKSHGPLFDNITDKSTGKRSPEKKKKREDILYLNIQREYFLEILEGIKTEEYRDRTEFYEWKLFARPYEKLRLRNGYHKTAPEIVLELEWIETAEDCYILHLGRILESKNLNILDR